MHSVKQKHSNLIEDIALAYQLIEPWEAGRLAALTEGTMAENPCSPGTASHAEWERGCSHGLQWDLGRVEEIELTDVAVSLPVMEIKVLPERAFWASALEIQVRCGLTNEQLAARIGVDVSLLMTSMMSHRLNAGGVAVQSARFVS